MIWNAKQNAIAIKPCLDKFFIRFESLLLKTWVRKNESYES